MTGTEIGYKLDKNAIKSVFIIGKIKKYRKCPALIVYHDRTCDAEYLALLTHVERHRKILLSSRKVTQSG